MRKLNQRGSAILVIILLMTGVFLASSLLTSMTVASSSANGSSFAKRRTFYAAESTRYVILKLLQSYLSSVINPVADDMQTYLNNQVPSRMPDGFEVQNLNVSLLSANTVATIANGPLKGMYAPQTVVRLVYDVQTKTPVSSANLDYAPLVNIEVTLAMAQVGMFEFLYFIDLDFADFSPGPDTIINGRVHTNGDLCLSATTRLLMSNMTSAGRIMFGSNSKCVYTKSGDNVAVATTADIKGATQKLSVNNQNGCTKCGTTVMPWSAYAPATWKGNLLDSTHGVTSLSLPVPTNIKTQLGADGDDPYTGRSNDRDLRFIVDPVNDGDSDDVASQKYAFKADVRIISGTWYLRDVNNARNWPGIPIWSDHPGSARDEKGKMVGQGDLRSNAPTAARWLTGGTPRLFSYYEYQYNPLTGSGALMDQTSAAQGVISYGNLVPVTGGGHVSWHPGHWLTGSTAQSICPSGTFSNNTPAGFVDAFDQSAYDCGAGPHPGVDSAILNSTRSGFHDGHIAKLYQDSYAMARGRVLTTNFDVERFQAALLNKTPGELGSYFGPGGLIKTPFNGIVYISNIWPGYDRGYAPPDSPLPPPIQDPSINLDPNQIDRTGPMQQRALPQSLCSDVSPNPLVAHPDKTFDAAKLFKIPDCAKYGTSVTPIKWRSYPTSVRVINGFALDPAKMPTDLSLVSSVGMYVQGEYNTLSNTTDENATPWLPSLLAADQIVFLSNAWNDLNSAWDDLNHNPNLRFAAPTTYNTAVITGWMRTKSSMPLHAFPAMMEDWNTPKPPTNASVPITYNGSIVIGFYPAFEREGRYWNANAYTYLSGPRLINFDRHFMFPKNQPPGSPLFYVSAVLDWKTH